MRTIKDQQLKHNDCGISAVKIVYNLYNVPVDRNYIEENIALTESGSGLHDIKDFFDKQYFDTSFNLLDLNNLKSNNTELNKFMPCILPVKNKQGQHYVVLKGIRKNKIEVVDPGTGNYIAGLFLN